ncbi:hypothetical protein GGS20DRAFT_524796 [Poronia punctata]|nr:hypothetical protein GGS20DRAFT_524796 [Poronia punctata]
MAFQQPTRQAARVFRPAVEDDAPQPQFSVARSLEDSQTWVLFSPATDAGTTTSYLTSTHASNITPGRSRLSDIGSFRTLAPSDVSAGHHQHSGSLVDAIDDDDDNELDSLDSHLPEFRSMPDFYVTSDDLPHSTPVVPAHDGLGSFRIEQEGMGADAQNRLYAFERYNPRRVTKRRESIERRLELETEDTEEADKIRRIESWRLEQSRYLLGEIQKETRRRRRSAASNSHIARADLKTDGPVNIAIGGEAEGDLDGEWHDHNLGDSPENRDSIWGRITRKVVRDLLGIDDKTLSVLFGEGLPDDEEDLCTTPKASVPLPHPGGTLSQSGPDSGWQVKMLEKVATELGLLVHQLSEHPGAFSTYSRMQQMPIPYAGLPAIPESGNDVVPETETPGLRETMPEFRPTIQPTTQQSPRPAGTPQTHPVSGSGKGAPHSQPDNGANFTQEEWEQNLDIRLVFRYLRSRFLSHSSGSSGSFSTSHLSTSSSPDISAKVARVRQNHPLVSRARNVSMERRISKTTTGANSALFRPVSSCASQSTRRSVRRSSCSSSRHYWDIGGSAGTGSMIATTGPMGSWGEV